MSNVVAVAGVLRKSCPGSECLQRKWPQVQRIDVRSILVPREHAESLNEHGIVGPLCHPFLFFSFAVHSWMLSQWIMMECLPTRHLVYDPVIHGLQLRDALSIQALSPRGVHLLLVPGLPCIGLSAGICCQTAGGQGMLATEVL